MCCSFLLGFFLLNKSTGCMIRYHPQDSVMDCDLLLDEDLVSHTTALERLTRGSQRFPKKQNNLMVKLVEKRAT